MELDFGNLKLVGAVEWIRSGRDRKQENQCKELLQRCAGEGLSQNSDTGEGKEGVNSRKLFKMEKWITVLDKRSRDG